LILFSDLHLQPSSESVCRSVLDAVHALAIDRRDMTIGFGGDWWNVRYALPVSLLNTVRSVIHLWTRTGIRVHVLPGNHDQYEVESGRHALEFLEDIPGVTVWTKPGHDPETGTWLPYRRDPRQLLQWLQENPPLPQAPPVAHLHHGIVGARMNSGKVAEPTDGLSPAALPFTTVYCGHWHQHQVVQNCVYVGSQWQTKSDEAGQQKGIIHAIPDPRRGWRTGPEWQFIPLDLGKKYHRVEEFSPAELARMRAGDVVRVPSGTQQKTVDALRALGLDVFSEAAPVKEAEARLGNAGSLRQLAEKYLTTQKLPDGLDATALMRAYDEVVES
jgi:hypothetical protein